MTEDIFHDSINKMGVFRLYLVRKTKEIIQRVGDGIITSPFRYEISKWVIFGQSAYGCWYFAINLDYPTHRVRFHAGDFNSRYVVFSGYYLDIISCLEADGTIRNIFSEDEMIGELDIPNYVDKRQEKEEILGFLNKLPKGTELPQEIQLLKLELLK